MKLDALAGNEGLKARLDGQCRGRGLAHAYILAGQAGLGKRTLAGLLSAAMVCTGEGEKPCLRCPGCRKAAAGVHPDIITVSGENGKELTVGQIRAMRTDAYIRPNEAERKIYVIHGADTMNQSAQNAMLKLLEEGPAYAVFLLLAENAAALLSTVCSRCEVLSLTPVSREEGERWLRARFPQADPAEISTAALRCGGVLGRAVDELSGTEADGELEQAARRLLDTLETGDELGRMELAVTLEKWDRERLCALLGLVRTRLVEQLARGTGSRERLRRLASSQSLLERLIGACGYNAAPGHLSGWLAAGLSMQE